MIGDPYPLHEQLQDHLIMREVARSLREERKAEAAYWDEIRATLEAICTEIGLTNNPEWTPQDFADAILKKVTQ